MDAVHNYVKGESLPGDTFQDDLPSLDRGRDEITAITPEADHREGRHASKVEVLFLREGRD